MAHLHYTTIEHRKGQHLSFAHRVLIQTRLKDGWSANRIAKQIGCAPNTVRNEIRRGTVALYSGAEDFQGRLVSGCLCRLCAERRFVYQRADCLHQNAVRIHRPGIARDKEY